MQNQQPMQNQGTGQNILNQLFAAPPGQQQQQQMMQHPGMPPQMMMPGGQQMQMMMPGGQQMQMQMPMGQMPQMSPNGMPMGTVPGPPMQMGQMPPNHFPQQQQLQQQHRPPAPQQQTQGSSDMLKSMLGMSNHTAPAPSAAPPPSDLPPPSMMPRAAAPQAPPSLSSTTPTLPLGAEIINSPGRPEGGAARSSPAGVPLQAGDCVYRLNWPVVEVDQQVAPHTNCHCEPILSVSCIPSTLARLFVYCCFFPLPLNLAAVAPLGSTEPEGQTMLASHVHLYSAPTVHRSHCSHQHYLRRPPTTRPQHIRKSAAQRVLLVFHHSNYVERVQSYLSQWLVHVRV